MFWICRYDAIAGHRERQAEGGVGWVELFAKPTK
jgi:hypothetical protein